MQRFVASGRHRGLGMQYTALALLVTAAALLGWVGPRAVYEHLRPYLAVDGRALMAWYQRQIITWLPVSEPPPALPDSPALHPRPTPATVTLVGESPRSLPDSPTPSPDRGRPHLPAPSPSARTVVAETTLEPDIALPLGADDLPRKRLADTSMQGRNH